MHRPRHVGPCTASRWTLDTCNTGQVGGRSFEQIFEREHAQMVAAISEVSEVLLQHK